MIANISLKFAFIPDNYTDWNKRIWKKSIVNIENIKFHFFNLNLNIKKNLAVPVIEPVKNAKKVYQHFISRTIFQPV